MPKVKLNQKQVDPLSEKLRGRIRCMDMTYKDVGFPVMSECTLARRLKNPDMFTIKELKHLSRTLNIPADEMRSYIKF